MMDLIKKAFEGLYPGTLFVLNAKIRYSSRFSSYNANVLYKNPNIVFSLSRDWKGVSEEMVIGLLQHLMRKLWKGGRDTQEQELYDIFLKKAHKGARRLESAPDLVESFSRVNDEYLNGMMDMPNLVWGTESFRKLGSYHYGSDRITISSALIGVRIELLDYVMYHELLHKKHQFQRSGSRSLHHSPAFKKDEASFKDAKLLEEDLARLGKKKGIFHHFF